MTATSTHALREQLAMLQHRIAALRTEAYAELGTATPRALESAMRRKWRGERHAEAHAENLQRLLGNIHDGLESVEIAINSARDVVQSAELKTGTSSLDLTASWIGASTRG